MNLARNLFPPRPKHNTAKDALERRNDQIEARLSRQAEDLRSRESALNERERLIRARERAVEREAHESFSDEKSTSKVSVATKLGTVPPAPGADLAAFIIAANNQRLGATEGVPLPTDKTARLIARFARGELVAEAPQPNTVAKMILNADKIRRGANIDELT